MPPTGVELLRKANCEACPLRAYHAKEGSWRPVPAEINEGTETVLLAPYPDKQSTDMARPAVGPFGAEQLQALQAAGHQRRDVSWTHVVACRYPNDRPEEFLGRLKKTRKAAERNGEPIPPTPEEACRPRLEAELAAHKNVVAFGTEALRAVGVPSNLHVGTPKLRDFRGFPTFTRNGMKLVPTAGPGKAYRIEPKWLPVMRQDMAKAFRHFAGALTWVDPKIVIKPTPATFRAFIESVRAGKKVVTFDVETAPYTMLDAEPDKEPEPLYDGFRDPLRCIGFGAGGYALVIPFLSVTGHTHRFIKADGSTLCTSYTPEERAEIVALIKELLADTGIMKVGHNAGYYDRLVCEHHFSVTPFPLLDTLIVHKLGDSEYFHSLGFCASVLTDVPPWKAEHTASTAKNDEELFFYNGRDLKVTKEIAKPLQLRAIQRNQFQLNGKYARLQTVAVGMHRLGMMLDNKRRLEHESRLVAETVRWSNKIFDILGEQAFNPNSPVQLARLLFDDWGLPVQNYTETGDFSTNDETLRALLVNPLVDARQKEFIHALRKWRGADKLLNTYVLKWAPGGALVDEHGYIHPDFAAHGTIGWRLSSSNPNFQNVPRELRDCFRAPEGFILVGADMDQLELRLAAALAGATYYLDAFTKNEIDPHNLSGQMVFGAEYWNQEGAPKDPRKKGEGAFANRRDLIKRFVYAALYGAHPPTIHSLITEAEDNQGNLKYANLTVQEIRRIHRRWLQSAPEFSRWWQQSVDMYRRDGYLEEPVWGLRRYFANGEKFNELVNYRVQGGGGAIVHAGMFDLVFGKPGHAAPLPFDFNRRTGLVLQVHDSLTFCVPEKDQKFTEDVIVENLTRRVPGIDVDFTAECKSGVAWK